jgi:hypothetical protein
MVCDGVLEADPLFVRAPFTNGPADYGDLRLRTGSPAIDAGLAAYLPADVWDLDEDGDTTEVLPIDILGQPRVQDAEVDLGAYEGGVVVARDPPPAPADAALTVAPNPVVGVGDVTLTLPMASLNVRVTIHDVLGREVGVVLERPLLSAGRHAFDLPAGLPSGVYAVRAIFHQGDTKPKVVVRRFSQLR